MKKVNSSWMILVGVLLSTATATATATAKNTISSAYKYGTAEQILNMIISSYSSTVADCGSSNRPALLCSGVLLRGRGEHNPNYYAWDPSQTQIAKNGVSFSFIRKDVPLRNLVYNHNNGFIFFPFEVQPAGLKHIHYRCAFPHDGATDSRVPDACGPLPEHPETNRCQFQSPAILTATQWMNKFGNSGAYVCGFDILDNDAPPGGAAEGFSAFMSATSTLAGNDVNEVITELWGKGDANILPMQAFFFIDGTAGLTNAQQNQADYLAVTHIWVPVIKITLPTFSIASAKFSYSVNEQGVPEPLN